MPSRILRDWTDSESVNSISAQAERFFVRLLMKMDDYGCFTADVRLLRAALFPLLIDQVREADIPRWIAECEKAGLVRSYEVESKRYLTVPKHGQRLRHGKRRFPAPADNLPQVAAGCGESRPDADVEVESDVEVEQHRAAPESLPGFDRWWAGYPAGPRKVNRKQCRKTWEANQLEEKTEDILRGLARWKREWAKDGNKFVPLPTTWLNQERWTAEVGQEESDIADLNDPPRKVTQDDIDYLKGVA